MFIFGEKKFPDYEKCIHVSGNLQPTPQTSDGHPVHDLGAVGVDYCGSYMYIEKLFPGVLYPGK